MEIKKISLRSMRELKVEEPTAIGVKAASGLVKSRNHFFVIADDELSLFQFNFEGQTQVDSLPLKQGDLPQDAKERKRQKPDWESLVKIEVKNHGAILLAIPSGSTENRMTGAFVTLDSRGLIDKKDKPIEVDFSEIYAALKEKISELNIEGACIVNNRLKLFQRGNGQASVNAIIDIHLDGFCNDFMNKLPVSPKHVISVKTYDLGKLGGFKLDFTDACSVDDTIWFLAVAEESNSTYEDGQYHGAILGCLDSAGSEISRYEIDCVVKPEGLWVEAESHRLCFYIVTDADNPTIYASIYFGKLIQ